MSGYDGEFLKALVIESTFNGDISKWNTGKVTTMHAMFYSLLRSTKTLGIGTQRK